MFDFNAQHSEDPNQCGLREPPLLYLKIHVQTKCASTAQINGKNKYGKAGANKSKKVLQGNSVNPTG